ncbi:hypothetical protein HY988_03450 [Candidatus Micrarchaeota archaeon]|nr:hypothetical protein [Candidatus Micrarchaeota archaeon]
MVKVRILKKQNLSYLELPPELFNVEEVELFKLKDGFYLISPPLAQTEPAQVPQTKKDQKDSKEITDPERLVLRKLLDIRFQDRIPPNVNKLFNDSEKKILKDLEGKKFIRVFKSAKYKDGVYNIDDGIYPVIMQNAQSGSVTKPNQNMQQNIRSSSVPSSSHPSSLPAIDPSDPFTLLRSQGFIVLADKNAARLLSDRLSQQVKTGEFVGIKGFDNKFYMVSRDYFNRVQSVISNVLKEDMSASSIATIAKIDPEGCTAVLRLMAENGDILEKRKGLFAPV